MTNKPMIALGFAAALMLGTAAQAQTGMQRNENSAKPAPTGQMQKNANTQNKMSKAQERFLKEAMEGDLSEMKVGELAQQKGQSEDVKQFGQMLQQDHSKNLQQAQQLAQQGGMTPPAQPSSAQKKVYDKLSKLSGNQFDRQFAKDMVSDHKKDLTKFEKEAKGKGPVAEFAQQTVPTLQKHLQTAQGIENKGASVGSGSKMK